MRAHRYESQFSIRFRFIGETTQMLLDATFFEKREDLFAGKCDCVYTNRVVEAISERFRVEKWQQRKQIWPWWNAFEDVSGSKQ